MKIFHHRVNSSAHLAEVPPSDGVEIDLRTINGRIVLQHDPFLEGEEFCAWMKNWRGQELILNVKEDGLEEQLIRILNGFAATNYFFLDQSFPSIMKCLNFGIRDMAVRVSDVEPYQSAIQLPCNWVWLDCFYGNWDFLLTTVPELKAHGKRLCLVSPELVRSNSEIELGQLQRIIRENELYIDAVCTKNKTVWIDYESKA